MGQEGLHEEAAKKILQKDYENLVRKVASGKTLTATERALVEARLVGSNQSTARAGSIAELAEALGVNRRTITNWRKLKGAPKTATNGQHDVAAWREFVRTKGLKGKEAASDVDALKRRRMEIDVEEREFRLSVRRGQYVAIDEVRQIWTTEVNKAIALLRQKFESELPPVLSGMDAVAIRQECARAIDEVCETLNEA
ncbi:MAG: hypothetical protein Q7P63_01205 [Verrucomicrobiota bacterium JB022]|nr:hypothetical protein [Verrucomicrobiota bacterium JB022]